MLEFRGCVFSDVQSQFLCTGRACGVQDVELKVSDVVVLIDRQQGGESRLAADNLKLHSAFTLSYILEVPPDSTCDWPSCVWHFFCRVLPSMLATAPQLTRRCRRASTFWSKYSRYAGHEWHSVGGLNMRPRRAHERADLLCSAVLPSAGHRRPVVRRGC